ncbi:MAG TPA: aminotransferase [Dongiaceae bacterium]|jgi:aspartate/methionine/tyrosine aminotransferase
MTITTPHYRVNTLLAGVAEPAIAEAQAWIAGRTFRKDKPLIDVCQAVPGYPPPAALTDHLASIVGEPTTSRYTDICGLPKLRAALAGDMVRFYGSKMEPSQVMITAGCNQAFCLAMMSLAQAGEEIIMPAPYYFNYEMWLQMLGIRLVSLSFRPEAGGEPDLQEAARAISSKTKAIVLVSPNNPTGAVYKPETLRAFHDLARERGIALVLDETYRDFLPQDGAPHDLFSDADWAGTLIHLYSFSKVFAMTGYRVGAIVAGNAFIEHAAKAMDCIAICAPRIGQEAAYFGISHLGDWRASNTRMLRARRTALLKAFARNDLGYELISAGAYFAYLKHPHRGRKATEVARRLVDRQNLLALPGSVFGPNQDDYLRVAFANVDAALMPEIAARLAADAADRR